MILRRLSEHVRSQNWLAVFLDFLIVVTGVLIALWASQWAAGRQGAAEARRAEASIEAELFDGAMAVYNFNASIPCSLEILSGLEAALVSDASVPPILLEARGYIPFGLTAPSTLARDQAAVTGAAAYLPRDTQTLYASAYRRLETIGAISARLVERTDVFRPLVLDRPLSEPERNAMLSELAWMRSRLWIIEGASESLFDTLAPLALEEQVDARRAGDLPAVINGLRGTYGDCVTPPDIAPYRDFVP